MDDVLGIPEKDRRGDYRPPSLSETEAAIKEIQKQVIYADREFDNVRLYMVKGHGEQAGAEPTFEPTTSAAFLDVMSGWSYVEKKTADNIETRTSSRRNSTGDLHREYINRGID